MRLLCNKSARGRISSAFSVCQILILDVYTQNLIFAARANLQASGEDKLGEDELIAQMA